jgi:hypothetical protein
MFVQNTSRDLCQPKKCPIGLEDAIQAHEEQLEVSFDLCQMGKTGLRAMNVRIEKSS